MLYLSYRLRLTEKARGNLCAFWAWARDQEKWFYEGIEEVLETQWHVCTVGQYVHDVFHQVRVEDEAAWGRYRAEISRRSKDPVWEGRRVEQDRWWTIEEAMLLSDAPEARS